MRKVTNFLFTLLLFIGGFGYASAATVSYSITEGATLEEFGGVFTITVEDATDVVPQNYAYFYLYRGASSDASKVLLASSDAVYNSDTNVFTVTFPNYNLWPDYPIQTDGDYCIMIPAKAYSLEGSLNEEKYINFMIDAPEKYITVEDVTIDPAPSLFEEVIPQITITLPEEVTSVDFNEVAAGSSDYYGTIKAKAQFGQVYNGEFYSSVGEYNIVAEGNKLILTPDETLVPSDLKEGDWGIRILRNSMYFNGDKTKTNENMVFAPYSYPQFLQLGFNPESGNKLVDFSKFTATIEYIYSTVVADENVVSKLYSLNTESEAYDYVCDLTTVVTMKKDSWGYDYAEVELIPNTTATLSYGKYRIVVPKGAVKTTDENPLVNAPISVDYEYIAPPTISIVPTWSISEGATVDKFSEVTMVFEEATQIDYVGEYDYSSVISINEVVDGVATPWGGGQGYLDVRIEGNKVRLYMNKDSFYPNYPIDKDGEYRVIVPKGKFAFEGVETFTNDELVLNFKVDAVEPYITADCATIDPAPSVVKHMANTFTVTLDGVEGEISVVEVTKSKYDQTIGEYVEYQAAATAELLYHSSFGYSYVYGEYNITVDGNKLILTPIESITPDSYWDFADYDVIIPKGILIVDNDPTKTNDRIEFGKYTIERLTNLNFTEPVVGEVDKLSTFVLETDAYSEPNTVDNTLITIAKWDEASNEYVVLNNAITSESAIDNSTGECVFTLSLATEVVDAGKYKVTVARGAYVWEDMYETYCNATLEGEFEIKAALDPVVAFTPIAIDPAEGDVDKIKEITITFDSQYFEDGLWCEDNAVAKVYDQAQEVVATASIASDVADAKVYITLAEEISAVGTYNVVIESGMISDYNNPEFVNPEITLTYNVVVAGLDAVEMDAKVFTVVTINGIVIKENATKNDVLNLEPGIYIVNGQKKLVRK